MDRQGEWSVSAQAAMRHIGELAKDGMSSGEVSARSGVSYSVITNIKGGRCERIHRVTEESILGIRIPEGEWEPVGGSRIDATGSRRRLQALGVQGFPLSFFHEEMAMAKTHIGDIRSGANASLLTSTSRAIRNTHEKLWDVDPVEMGIHPKAIHRTKIWAQKYKWWPTEAWADIDDPDCKPVLKTPRYVILTENYRELAAWQNATMAEAADRLGVSKNTLDKAVRYYDMRMAQQERRAS